MKQTILMTGATSGFGQVRAELFATKGRRLIVCGREEERLRELQARPPAARQAIDVLLNNAGLAQAQQPELTGCEG